MPKKLEVRYNERLGQHQMWTGQRWRQVEKRNCSICGDEYWHVLQYTDRGDTCGKRSCRAILRRKTMHSKYRRD